jgi:glyoxylase-like metal-dependent hydrolase (beta-lactamase superfamily II)
MKVVRLRPNPDIYCCNSYLVLGDWNKLDDINTLIDTGSDAYILNEILKLNTGVGKVPVEKIILTHLHFDHCGGVQKIREQFRAKVFSWIKFDEQSGELKDGELVRLGDSYFEIIHTPGHSSDSICLYNKSQGILFSGDTQIRVNASDGTFTDEYRESIKRLAALKIGVIYPGHGNPIEENPEEILQYSLRNVKRAGRQKQDK